MKYFYKNWYWLIPLLVAVLGGAYIWYLNGTGQNGSTPKKDKAPSDLDKNTVLYNGISGKDAEVKYLQEWLNANGGTLTVDGDFGEKTAEELYKQKKRWDIALKDL